MNTHRIGIHSSVDHQRLRYTVAFLDEHPLCRAAAVRFTLNNIQSENTWNMDYGSSTETADSVLSMPAQGVFFDPALQPVARLHLNAYTQQADTYYSVEVKERPNGHACLIDNHFQFDLLEAIFFHISRYEEVFAAPDRLGPAGWLAEENHLLIKDQLEKQPQADRLVALLLEGITGKKIIEPTTYDLTHDIDFLYRYPDSYALLRALVGTLYRREGLTALRHHLQRYAGIRLGKAKDPYNCFDWLLSPDTNWTVKQLYLMTGGETDYDNHYALKDPALQPILQLARERGYQIGLHPSYNAGFNPTLFRAEFDRFREFIKIPAKKSRQHWLRFNWELTPTLLTDHHIEEDASMGYSKRLGFRCGTGFPYYLYDFRKEQAYPWKERPLACMESAALHEARGQGKDLVKLLNHFLQKNEVNTHLSVNFHNSNFDPALPAGRQLADFYRKVVLPLGK